MDKDLKTYSDGIKDGIKMGKIQSDFIYSIHLSEIEKSLEEAQMEIGRLQSVLSRLKRETAPEKHTCSHHPYLTCTACYLTELLKDEFDNCELCHGTKGGVRGNENIKDGVVMCDYCSSQWDKKYDKGE